MGEEYSMEERTSGKTTWAAQNIGSTTCLRVQSKEDTEPKSEP